MNHAVSVGAREGGARMYLFKLNNSWALGGSIHGGFSEVSVSQALCAGDRDCGRRRQSIAEGTVDIWEAWADLGNLGSGVSGVLAGPARSLLA